MYIYITKSRTALHKIKRGSIKHRDERGNDNDFLYVQVNFKPSDSYRISSAQI